MITIELTEKEAELLRRNIEGTLGTMETLERIWLAGSEGYDEDERKKNAAVKAMYRAIMSRLPQPPQGED